VSEMKQSLTTYREGFRFDLVAGLTVAVVALPLALGFGLTSGAGPGAGLVTAIVAGFFAGVFGGSDVQVSGPTGAMVVVLVPIVAQFGVSALVIVGFGAGVLMILAGVFRLGLWAEKIPWPVMEGFTLGIALIIALQQIPIIFDVPRGGGTETLSIAIDTLREVASSPLHVWSIALVVGTLGIKGLWRRLGKSWTYATHLPASAVAIVIVTGASALLHFPVATIGALPGSELFSITWSPPEAPVFPLLYAAFVVAILGSVESLLAARVGDAMVHRRDGVLTSPYAPNRELIGQGVATMVASAVGGMPATGAIARTAVNVHAGARTRVATMIHSLTLLAFVLVLAPVVGSIPVAALAGVLLGTSWKIANPASIKENMQTTWPGKISYLTTSLCVVAIDLIWGTLIGIITYGFTTMVARKRSGGA
jgi:SulP family sulfate permease